LFGKRLVPGRPWRRTAARQSVNVRSLSQPLPFDPGCQYGVQLSSTWMGRLHQRAAARRFTDQGWGWSEQQTFAAARRFADQAEGWFEQSQRKAAQARSLQDVPRCKLDFECQLLVTGTTCTCTCTCTSLLPASPSSACLAWEPAVFFSDG